MSERELFLQALEIKDPAERADFLEHACANQPDLRRHVNQLLKAHEFAGQFLDQPHPVAAAGEHTGAYASDVRAAETAGIVIAGRYKLLQCIGEGGMGSVWMADQLEPVKRRVAVKLIQAERDTSRTILSRFEAERQAIALMDHPNIAKLLDAGTTGERSFNRDSTGSVADPAVVWHFRGLAYGEQEQWAKAASDFAKCMHLQSPFASLSGGWRSLALAAAGDMPGYRKACAELLEEFSTAQDPGKANDAAWFCVRFPGAV